jgi:hypothetical protein
VRCEKYELFKIVNPLFEDAVHPQGKYRHGFVLSDTSEKRSASAAAKLNLSGMLVMSKWKIQSIHDAANMMTEARLRPGSKAKSPSSLSPMNMRSTFT